MFILIFVADKRLSPKDAIKYFGMDLLKVLPLDSVMFLYLMDKPEANLLPFDYKAKIMSDKLSTRAEKVSFFIEKVLKPNPDFCLPALLDVMEKCDDIAVVKLSIDIRKKTILCKCDYTVCTQLACYICTTINNFPQYKHFVIHWISSKCFAVFSFAVLKLLRKTIAQNIFREPQKLPKLCNA